MITILYILAVFVLFVGVHHLIKIQRLDKRIEELTDELERIEEQKELLKKLLK